LDIIITDDNNNEVDFNSIDWTITIEVEATMQIPQIQKSISEYLNDMYASLPQQTQPQDMETPEP
jgi:hypothetical protein